MPLSPHLRSYKTFRHYMTSAAAEPTIWRKLVENYQSKPLTIPAECIYIKGSRSNIYQGIHAAFIPSFSALQVYTLLNIVMIRLRIVSFSQCRSYDFIMMQSGTFMNKIFRLYLSHNESLLVENQR